MTEEMDGPFPVLRQVVLDTTDARGLAEFYRQLLDYTYRAGDEPPPPGVPDEQAKDWLVLCAADGGSRIAFQPVAQLLEPTWPRDGVPQQLHLDLRVPSVEDLDIQHRARYCPRCPAPPRPVRRQGGASPGLRRPGRPPLLHLCGSFMSAAGGAYKDKGFRRFGHSTWAIWPPRTAMLTVGEVGSSFRRT